MKTQNNEYIPVPNSLALTTLRERRLMIVRKTGALVFRVTWKALVYAFILTIANVII